MTDKLGSAGGASKGNDGPVFRANVRHHLSGRPCVINLVGFGMNVEAAIARLDASDRARPVQLAGVIIFGRPQ